MDKRVEAYYFDRDLSWLSYNHILLEEAANQSRPLYDRIRLLAEFADNLDDFFKYRVSALRSLLRVEKRRLKRNISDELGDTLEDIVRSVEEDHEAFQQVFQGQILPEMEAAGVHLYLGGKPVLPVHSPEVAQLFMGTVLPMLRTITIRQKGQLPGLINGLLYFACTLQRKTQPHEPLTFATVNIPTERLPRFFELSPINEHTYLISLDEVIRTHLHQLFPAYEIRSAHTVKWYKYMELLIDDEFRGKFAERIRKHLERKQAEHTQRFLFEREMPQPLLDYFRQAANLEDEDLVHTWQYHNFSDFANLPNPKDERMLSAALPTVQHPRLRLGTDVLEEIRQQDILLHYPFHGFEQGIAFFQQAATDPDVVSIRVTLNRFIPESITANALASAARNGKQVTVFAQTKSRPDQTQDFQWASEMQRIGVKVIYSVPGYRVPGKMALIERQMGNQKEFFAYLGAGSFNPSSLDAGFGLMTCRHDICMDLEKLFRFFSKRREKPYLSRMLVSQVNMLERFKGGIHQEIQAARQGKQGHIILRLNSLEDSELIDWLYRANKSGVKVDLIIRGICRLRPGLPGRSENIRVVRPIDGFRETTRAYWFANIAPEEQLHIGSADWMERNQLNRIEFAVPILPGDQRDEIIQLLQLELADNESAKALDSHNQNRPIAGAKRWAKGQFHTYLKNKSRAKAGG